MKHFKTTKRDVFEVLHETGSSQAAMMTLPPGESSSEGSTNEHAWAEQWLYVVSGEGVVRDGRPRGPKKKRVALAPGSLLLIEKGEPHEIENTSSVPLVTLNIYVPPAYDDDGEPLYGGTDP
jgi:mannose-6-phosphate isomerase-like protein (cupin superfamily)